MTEYVPLSVLKSQFIHNNRVRPIVVALGRVLSIKYASDPPFRIHILTWLPVGLYPGNGLYSHLDYSSDKAAPTRHRLWDGLPWVLAARHVRLLDG